MQHCYSAEISSGLIVVNIDIEHIYIFINLKKQTATHDLRYTLKQGSPNRHPMFGTDAPINVGLRAVQASLMPTSNG